MIGNMIRYAMRKTRQGIQSLWREEEGMGVVEVILIIIVLIGLVIIFRDSLRELVESLFSTLTDGAEDVWVD